MEAKNPNTGNLEKLYVKALDSMPVGTIVDFDGQTSDIPTGWETYGTGQIKKTSETRALAGYIANAHNDSQISAYSSDYANKAFGGKLLWTNPNPTSSMAGDTEINLSSDDYDVLEIFFLTNTTDNRLEITKVLKGYNARLTTAIYSSNIYCSYRNINRVSDTKYKTDSNYYGTSSPGTNNSYCIPLYIIGYKTGLFN